MFFKGKLSSRKVRPPAQVRSDICNPSCWAQSPPLPPGVSPDLAPAATLQCLAIWKCDIFVLIQLHLKVVQGYAQVGVALRMRPRSNSTA